MNEQEMLIHMLTRAGFTYEIDTDDGDGTTEIKVENNESDDYENPTLINGYSGFFTVWTFRAGLLIAVSNWE